MNGVVLIVVFSLKNGVCVWFLALLFVCFVVGGFGVFGVGVVCKFRICDVCVVGVSITICITIIIRRSVITITIIITNILAIF